MSDFLTNVAARAIAAPALRPRARMRFEPPDAEPAPLLVDSPGTAGAPPARPPIVNPAPSAPQQPPTQPATRNPQPELREVIRNVEAQPKGTATREEPLEEPREEKSVDAPPPPTRIETIIARAAPEIETIVETREIVRDRVIASLPQTMVQHDETPHRLDEQPPRVEQKPAAATTATTADAPQREHASREQQTPPARRRNARNAANNIEQQRRRANAQPQLRGEETSAASEPVVHVSIGRVEVRAVTNAPAQKRAPQASPVMTIDDYVARRDAKDRR
jgi:hypothetical protein